MSDIVAVVIENPEQPIKAILAPGTGEVAGAVISQIGPDGLSGYSGYSGKSGFSGYSGFSGFSGYSGFSGDPAQQSGYSGFSGKSGYSGFCGLSGYSGFCGLSGYSGYCGASGQSGYSGYSGFCGQSGYSGFCGLSGYSGFCGLSGYSGFCGLSGYSGYSGIGTSGFSGYSGFCGLSGYSGFCGLSGYSGFCGLSGYSGFSGANPGASGYSGFCGLSGYSGFCGLSGYSGYCGLSGYSGYAGSGLSGYSGYCGSGVSGYSGFCGTGTSGYSGFFGTSGYSGFCGNSGYSGFSGPAGTGSFLSENVARVDVSGNDGTGVVGDMLLPFLTVQGAIDAIESGSFAFPVIDVGTYRDLSGTVTTSLRQLTFVGNKDSIVCSDLVLTQTSNTVAIKVDQCRILTSISFNDNAGVSIFCYDTTIPDVTQSGTGPISIHGVAAGGIFNILSSITTTTAGFVFITNLAVDGIDCAGVDVRLERCLIDGDVVACNVLTLVDSRFIFGTNGASSTVYDDQLLIGIGPGGTTGQIQAKSSNDDFDVEWINQPASGYSGYSGYSGFSGKSGYSGFSSLSGYSGYSGAIGFAGTAPYWPQDTASDIGTYNDILTTPESGAEATASAVCNNNQVLIQAYATPSTGLGLTIVPSGEWTFDFFASVTSLSLASDLVVKVYSRTSGGVETLLFTTTSPTFTSTSVTEYEWSTIQAEFAISLTDRLVVKVYGETAIPLNTTVAYTYLGQTHYSRIISSFTPVGISGFSGYSGKSGYSGYSGSGVSGYSGYSGSGISGYSGYSGSGVSGYSGYCGLIGQSGYSGYSGPAINKLLVTQNVDLGLVANAVVTKTGTVTGNAGVGSSLFLERMMIPAAMTITEIQCAMSIGFPATSQGAGTMSRSMVVYSFGNATSLASVISISGTSAWATGTSTAGGNTSLTQYQGGWSAPFIQPMTFGSSVLAPGEYVVGQLFNFAQASSTWTLAFYGDIAASTLIASAATNLTSATVGVLSSAGLGAGSGVTGVSSYASGFLALSTAGSLSAFTFQGTVSTAASSQVLSVSTLQVTVTNSNKSVSFQLIGNQANSNIISSIGTVAGSIHTGSTSIGAVTNVALGALNSTTLAQLTQPNFGFIGTGSTTSGFPTAFFAGIMSTGAIPTAITLTSAAVTYSGSVAFQQPWFAMVGS